MILTRDVTDQLLAERRLDTANEELRRLSHELMNSQEAERAHLARELHDDISQMLAGLSLCMVPGPACPQRASPQRSSRRGECSFRRFWRICVP